MLGKRCLDSARGKSVRHSDFCRISPRWGWGFSWASSREFVPARRAATPARLAPCRAFVPFPSLAGAQAPVARGSGDEKSPAFRRAFAAGLHLDSAGDSYRIQTCNLLIRSQMLYSVELRSRFGDDPLTLFFGRLFFYNIEFFLLNSCFFT